MSKKKRTAWMLGAFFLLAGGMVAYTRILQEKAPEKKIARVKPVWINFDTGANVKAMAFEGDYLWLGLPNGLIRYDTRTQDTYEVYTARTTGGGLLSNGIYEIAVDPQGNKWVGTYGGGLAKFDGKNWTTFTPYGGGSTRTYGEGWTLYPIGTGVGDLWIYDILFHQSGEMWIATWKGVSRFDGKRFTTYTTEDGLVDKWVYGIGIDHEGIFWFGTEGGVTRYDGTTWKSFTHADGLGAEIEGIVPEESYEGQGRHHSTREKRNIGPNPNFVLSVAVDKENNKWFGTWGAGLSRFNGKDWTTYTTETGIGGNFVHALAVDEKGILWAGTNGGVSRFDGKTWKTYTTKDGLWNNNVFSIAFDSKGNSWFGTWRGVSKLSETSQ